MTPTVKTWEIERRGKESVYKTVVIGYDTGVD